MLKFSNKFSNSRDAIVFFAGEGFSFKSKAGLFGANEEKKVSEEPSAGEEDLLFF